MKISARFAGLAIMTMLSTLMPAQDKPAVKSDLQTYRLNYTITETDNGKKVGVQHFAQTETPGNLTSMVKLGSRIPIEVPGQGVTYLDIGLNISTQLFEQSNGLEVRTVVEQTSVVDQPGGRSDHPIIRQARLESTAVLPPPGKPVVLGSVDIPGSTRHLEVELVLERIP